MITIPALMDLTPVAYMGSVLMWYWLAVLAMLFVGVIPALLLVSSTVKMFIGILKRANIYG